MFNYVYSFLGFDGFKLDLIPLKVELVSWVSTSHQGYTFGRQVQQLVCDNLPEKAGSAVSLASDTSKLLLQQTLLRQTDGKEGEGETQITSLMGNVHMYIVIYL